MALVGLTACASRGTTPVSTIRNPDAASRLRVAMAAEASGQLDVALSMYEAAASASPGDMEVQARYAAALARVGQVQEAEQVLARGLERQPRDPRLLIALGQLRLRAGAAPEAIALFDQVLVRRPRDVVALNGRGIGLDLLGRHADAQQSYRAAQAVDPGHIPTANNLALSLMLDGHPAEAVAILSSLSRRSGVPPRVTTNFGIAQAAAGDVLAAQSTLAGRVDEADLDRIIADLKGTQPSLAPETRDSAGSS